MMDEDAYSNEELLSDEEMLSAFVVDPNIIARISVDGRPMTEEMINAHIVMGNTIKNLVDRSRKLERLEAYGVDNWEGYGSAMSDSMELFGSREKEDEVEDEFDDDDCDDEDGELHAGEGSE